MHDLTDAEQDDLLAHAHYRCLCAVAEYARGKDDKDDLPGILKEFWDLAGEPFLAAYYTWARPEYADVCLSELAWSSLRQAGFHVQLLSSEPEAMTAHLRTNDDGGIDAKIRSTLPPWLGVRMACCYPAGASTWLVRLEREVPEALTDEKGAG